MTKRDKRRVENKRSEITGKLRGPHSLDEEYSRKERKEHNVIRGDVGIWGTQRDAVNIVREGE
jgi:hypothetical protein